MGKDKWLRAGISHGLSKKEGRVDKGNGVIYGVAVVTVGEAKGHNMWVDGNFIDATVEQGNLLQSGLKSRFGHPNASNTALGTFLGRQKNFRRIGDSAYSDLYLDKTAFDTPNGNLAKYTMELAENDPEAFGASIVFDRNGKAEKIANSKPREDGLWVAVLGELKAGDVVDQPAANPSGFFSDTNMKFSEEMTLFLDKFLANPDAITEVMGFLEKYQANKKTVPDQESYDCECIECGHKMTSEKHCQDIKCSECGGTMRRASRPGIGQKQEEKQSDKEEPKETEKETLQEKTEKKEETMGTEKKDVIEEKDAGKVGEVKTDGLKTAAVNEKLQSEVQANKDEIVNLTKKNTALEVSKFMSENENQILPAFSGLAESLLVATYSSKEEVTFSEADGTEKTMLLSESVKELFKRLPAIEMGDTGKQDPKKVPEVLNTEDTEMGLITARAKEKNISQEEATDELLSEGKITLVREVETVNTKEPE